jgi:putative transposase
MEKSTTPAGVVPAAIVEEAWQQVGASFERFCLTAGIATLAGMMEGDAAGLCGVRYGRDDGRDGYRWGRTKGKLGFHGARSSWSGLECAPAMAARSRCRAGKRHSPRIG